MMIPTAVAVSAFTLILISLIIYLIAAHRTKGISPDQPVDYFLAKNRALPDEYGNAQVAYALQMSTVYPFFVLTVSGNWAVPFVNTIFWGFGIWLMYKWLPKFSRGAIAVLGESKTIHSFIASTHNAPGLRRLASGLSILGFIGLLAFEIVWGASIFKTLFGGNQAIYYLAITILALYLIMYLWGGGQLSAIRTDQFQLVIAYLGLHLAVAAIVANRQVKISELSIPWLPLVVLLLSGAMIVYRIVRLWKTIRSGRGKYLALLYPIVIISLFYMMLVIARKPGVLREAFHWPRMTFQPDLGWMLATAAVLSVFWQFIDLTNWQRLTSLSSSSAEAIKKQASIGLRQYLVESPLSWLLPILLGLCITGVIPNILSPGQDAFDRLTAFLLSSGSTREVIAGVFFCAGVVAIFMSTADALLSAIGYAFAFDIWHVKGGTAENRLAKREDREKVVSAGRNFMAGAFGVVIFLFIIFDVLMKSGQQLLGFFFAFYTPMIAFSPAIILPALSGRRAPAFFAWAAICSGAVAGIACGIYSIWNTRAQWFAAPAAFVLSWSIYGLALLFNHARIPLRNPGQGQP